jgi:hypothetical protein
VTGSDPVEIAARLATVLEGLGVRYVLGGSLASTTFGEPRATLDVDIAADLRTEHVRPFVAALGRDFVIDEAWVAAEVARRGSFQAVHVASMIRVDVFVPEWTGLHLWKWEQRRRVTLPGPARSAIDVTSPEGIVLQKLSWYRGGGEVSDRQWRDVLGVLKTQGEDLQRQALREWATRLAIVDLLERALREAGLAGA